MNLRKKIENAINEASAENGSNTPDFILADYLMNCLSAFDRATNWRKEWSSPEGVTTNYDDPRETGSNLIAWERDRAVSV